MASTKKSRKREEDAEKSSGASKPVSFHPLTFEESLDALLSVEPPKEEQKEAKKRAVKKAAKK
jgi:hypothetical protein